MKPLIRDGGEPMGFGAMVKAIGLGVSYQISMIIVSAASSLTIRRHRGQVLIFKVKKSLLYSKHCTYHYIGRNIITTQIASKYRRSFRDTIQVDENIVGIR